MLDSDRLARLCLTVLACSWFGCETFIDFPESAHLGGGGSTTQAGAGSSVGGEGVGGAGGAGGTGGGGPVDPCLKYVPPTKPAVEDGNDDITFVTAMRSVNLGERDDVPADGFNLDGLQTCETSEGSVTDDFPSSCQKIVEDEGNICDSACALDVQSASVFSRIQLVSGQSNLGSEVASESASEGRWSLLSRVEGYNGGQNDKSVRLSMYSNFPFPKGQFPLWNGQDVWDIDNASVTNDNVNQPKFFTDNAWVRDGKLYAAIDETVLVIRTAGDMSLEVRLHAGQFLATIVPTEFGYALRDGILGGKWEINDFFGAMDNLRTGQGDPFCTDNPFWNQARDTICNALDINAAGASIAADCDSMSLGIGFTADPATLGIPRVVPAPKGGCTPETLPSTATCPGLGK